MKRLKKLFFILSVSFFAISVKIGSTSNIANEKKLTNQVFQEQLLFSGTGQLIVYPFKVAGGKISDAFCYFGGKLLGAFNWFADSCGKKCLIFLGVYWILKTQFKLGWWYINSKYSKKYIILTILLTTITTALYGIKAYNIGQFILERFGYVS